MDLLSKTDSTSNDHILHDLSPFFRVHKDGTIERLLGSPIIPPSDGDATKTTGVRSKDVFISMDPKVGARLFLPQSAAPNKKLPLLVYIHGGGFTVESAFSLFYTSYLNSLVANSNVIAVSIDYRLGPESQIPACYEDSWAVMKWVASHEKGEGPDPWINEHADFGRVFLAGDSAGGNIAHNMVTRVGVDGLGQCVKIAGMILAHPFFGNDKPDRIWSFICPEDTGVNDPRLNPASKPDLLAKLGCGKVMVCIAGKDFLRERGWSYYEALQKSKWGGELDLVETEGEDHVFHLFNPTCEKAGLLMKLMASFINNDKVSSSL